LFIDALGEVASVVVASAAGSVAEVVVVLAPAATPASVAVGALDALSAEELGAGALLSIAPCGAGLSFGIGAVASVAVDWVVSGWADID